MDEKTLLESIRGMMQEELAPIKERLTALEEGQNGLVDDVAHLKDDVALLKDDLAALKEGQDETRGGVNSLLEWADTVSVLVKVPLKPAQ